jgi:hypothetical protein
MLPELQIQIHVASVAACSASLHALEEQAISQYTHLDLLASGLDLCAGCSTCILLGMMDSGRAIGVQRSEGKIRF